MSRFHLPLPGRPRRGGRAVLITAAIATALVAGSATAGNDFGSSPLQDGADGTADVLSLGDTWSPWNPAPGEMGTWGASFAADQVLDKDYCAALPSKLTRMPCVGRTAKRVLTTWSRNYDDPGAIAAEGSAVSEDNGRSFSSSPDGRQFQNLSMTTVLRLRDGRVISAEGVPTADPVGNILITIGSSSDVGRTWTKKTAKVVQPATALGWIRVQRGLMQLTDGTLLLAGYGAIASTGESVSLVFQSTDDATTWTVRSVIHGPARGINEMDMARTSDGRLIGLFRQTGNAGVLAPWPLLQGFSDDDGKTWSTLTELTPPAGITNVGIDPNIVLLPNGTLMASYGRPDNQVILSWDGTGRTWDTGQVVFANPVRDTDPGRYDGSSGNTSLQSVGSNYALYTGDTCHTVYFCRELGQQPKIFIRRIDATKPGTGKIDLMTRYLDGTVKLAGAVLPANPLAPESRLAGAIDGSTGPTAAAFLKSGSAFTLTLDQVRRIDRLGLMLGNGMPQSVDIQTSKDGRTWGRPVAKIRNSVDYAMRYYTFEPVAAKYVRITPTRNAAATITELEVYDTDTFTFENDAPNAVPRGLTNTRYAWVADYLFPGLDSQKRMILVDMDPHSVATATVPAPPVEQQHASFGYSGEGYGAGVVFDVNGKDAAGKDITAWRFLMAPDWTTNSFKIQAWDGGAWRPVGAVPNMPANELMFPISIDTTADTARLSINGTELTSTVRAAAGVSYDGLTFSSNGDAAVNMEHSFDEITVTELAPYSVSSPVPTHIASLPGISNVARIAVRNNTDRALTVPVSTEIAAGFSVERPTSVTVPANGSANVDVGVTRSDPAAAATSLSITIGDQTRTVQIDPTSDWVRGAAMTASSTIGGYSPEALNDGRADPAVWGAGLGWNDATSKVFPDWVTATWQQPVTLSRTVVVTLDSTTYPASAYGAKDFDVQVKAANGDWTTVAQVRNNLSGTVTSTFAPVQTTALRILVIDSGDHTYSRLIGVSDYTS